MSGYYFSHNVYLIAYYVQSRIAVDKQIRRGIDDTTLYSATNVRFHSLNN